MEKIQSKESRFLQGYSKIKVTTICKKHGYDVSNIQKGKSKNEYEKIVMREILKELMMLLADVYFSEDIEVISCRAK